MHIVNFKKLSRIQVCSPRHTSPPLSFSLSANPLPPTLSLLVTDAYFLSSSPITEHVINRLKGGHFRQSARLVFFSSTFFFSSSALYIHQTNGWYLASDQVQLPAPCPFFRIPLNPPKKKQQKTSLTFSSLGHYSEPSLQTAGLPIFFFQRGKQREKILNCGIIFEEHWKHFLPKATGRSKTTHTKKMYAAVFLPLGKKSSLIRILYANTNRLGNYQSLMEDFDSRNQRLTNPNQS